MTLTLTLTATLTLTLTATLTLNPNPNPKKSGSAIQDTYFPQDEMAHVVFKIIGKIIFHKTKLRGHLFSLGSNKFAGTT